MATVDHAAAGLNGQVAFESEIGFLEKSFIVLAAKSKIFNLNHDDRNVVVVEIQTADIIVCHAGHREGALACLFDTGDERVCPIAWSIAGVIAFAPAE